MQRVVESELLDTLPPTHQLAIGSRADIWRLNRLMGNPGILRRAWLRHLPTNRLTTQALRVVDLGAGEGLVMRQLARDTIKIALPEIQLTLVDCHNVVAPETWEYIGAAGWRANLATAEVLEWLENPAPSVDVMFVNLLLHQFSDGDLKRLLQLIAARTKVLIACEPRRSSLALAASRGVRFIGCNAVTRHDAIVSVRAGFAGPELSALWPTSDAWQLTEQPAGWCSHLFIAKRS